MNLKEYARYDGLGLAELVRRRQVSRRELAQLGLQAIETLNPQLNAVIETYADAAAGLDERPDTGNRPFYGVPFLLKDIGSHDADVRFELGSRMAQGLQAPPHASELVRRFRETGVTILGRTNVPELGSSCTTEPLLHGPTLNPWNLERTPGGSSGGAAAAVAAGMTPIAHANDAGGSIRWPAACCGLFGLKPSRNLNPIGPDEALAVNGLAAEHIVSRSVRDSAAMLDATAGPDVGAWCYTPRLDGSYLYETMKPVGKLRIALNLTPNFPPTPLAPEVVAAVRDTAALLTDLGHEVEEASLDLDIEQALRCNFVMWASGLRKAVVGLAEHTGRAPSEDTLEPHILAAYLGAESLTATDLQWALGYLNAVTRAYGAFFERYDVMLTPAGAMEPFAIGRIGAIDTSNFYDWYVQMMAHCPFLSSVNMAGVPAMSVPLSWSPSGLPIGSHFVGRLGAEPLLLRLAAQLEAARPWFGRTPPLYAGA